MISSSYSGFADLLRYSSMTPWNRDQPPLELLSDSPARSRVPAVQPSGSFRCWICSPTSTLRKVPLPCLLPPFRLISVPSPSLTAGLVLRAPLTGDVELRNVAFAYQMRSDRPVLRDLSLHIRPGQVRCVGDVVACGVCLYATGNLERLLLLLPLFASSTLEILGWLPHVSMLRF